mgnify:CR=1 FL=1
MVRFSVIVPIYNLGEYLQPMLDTLAKQTVDFELWLVSDGSTDQSLARAEQFVRGIANWHALEILHGGISAARNVGLKYATGDAIAFVDGDDRLTPDFVQTLQVGFSQPDIVATAVGYCWWGVAQRHLPGWLYFDQAQMFDQVTQHGSAIGGYVWNKAFRRAAIGDLRFDERLHIAEDYWFTANLVAQNPGRYAFEPNVRYMKVTRLNSTIHTVNRRQEAEVFDRIHRLAERLNHRDDHNRHD